MTLHTKITVVLLLFSAKLFSQSLNNKVIEIKAVDFSIKTFFSVSCYGFEKSFSSEIRVNNIYSSDTLKMFQRLIKGAKKSSENTSPDIRVKICLPNENNLLTTLCMDKFGNIVLNDNLIQKDKELIKLIRSCLD